jgi:hypothetical protein
MQASHITLGVDLLPTHTIFVLRHLELTFVCRSEGWLMDYEKSTSPSNDTIQEESNLNHPTHELIGKNKCLGLKFSFLPENFKTSSLLPTLDTSQILNLIYSNKINQGPEGEPQYVRCLIIKTPHSSYYVMPNSIEIEDTLGSVHKVSLSKIPPLMERPITGGVLRWWFTDKMLFQKDNPKYIL